MRERITFKMFMALIAALFTVGMTSEKAQSYDENVKKGQWEYESVAAFEDNVEHPFNMERLECCVIPAEINIDQDVNTLIFEGETEIRMILTFNNT